ncbi:MAG: glycosylated S-layer protein, SlaA [Saccharolobus sp.]
MNKNLGLILTSIFLISTLGIIPGLVLTTQASPPTNPAAAIYTLPHIVTITSTTKSVNVFLNPYGNSTAKYYLSGYDFGKAINATINATTIIFNINKTTYSYDLPTNLAVAAYYDQANVSVFFVLNLQGGNSSPYTPNYAKVVNFEMSANLPPSNVSNYKNQSLGLSDYINALNLGYLLSQATKGKYYSISQLPVGSQIIISYNTSRYSITLVKIQVLPAQLVNPLQQAGVIPNPGYVQAVGRSNITIGVYDPNVGTSSTPFNFTLTYSSQTPAVINWFVLANETSTFAPKAKVSSNFAAPIFGIYNTSNDSIFYKSTSMPSILQFNGQMNVTAHENVTGTLQTGTYIYTSPNFNVTPNSSYTFSGRLNVLFNGYIFTNGSAKVTAYIFNGSVSFFFPSINESAMFTFFMSPILPINTTAYIGSPQSVLVVVNSSKMFVAFPSVVVEFEIDAFYGHFSDHYYISAGVTESELNGTNVTKSFLYPGAPGAYYYSSFISKLYSSSKLFSITNFGFSTTTLTGTSLTFNVLMPLEFTVEKLGYIYLVIFKIWGPSTTVTVSGVDHYGAEISAGTFRSYIALPTYYSTPKVPLSNITCDNRYTLVQVKDVGAVLYTVQNNVNANNASINGEWDLMTYPHVPSYLNSSLHIAVYNGTKLKYNTTIGILPNATTTPVTLTITLQGQTVSTTYSTVPSAIYPVALKFAPSSSYSVTTDLIYNTSVPLYVVTVYMPLDYILNTKIVLWYVSPDFAAYYYYNTTGQFKTSNFTITFANITPELQMPQVFPVSKLYMPFGIIDPYYVFYNSISLGPVNGVIEFVENGHVVGNITSIKLQINGMNQTIVLSPANVSKLLITPNLGEVSQCSPVFNAPQAFNITALAKLLGLPNVSALNGSTLYITYHDRISGAYVTNKTLLTVGEFYIMPPTIPGSVEWILTAKYINATTGIPVEISYGVVQQPSANIVDLNLVNSSNINYLQVINVKIVSKYATAEVMYNPSNASTIVYMNGMFVASYSGNLLPTIPETTTAGKFSGPVVNLYVAPGTLSSPNGTMYVVLGSHKVAIGTANLYTYAGYHFGPYTALPLVSNVTFTVEDPLIHTTLTGQTTLGAFNNTPIRIYPLNMPITPSSSYKVFYYYTKPLTLSPTSQYIVISATSVISYPYPFYIESVVFLGSNVTTGTPVPGTPAFQTVYSPALGPGVVLQVPVQMYQAISLSTPSSPHTVVMFAVPFAGGPAISEYPTFLVYTNVTAMSS